MSDINFDDLVPQTPTGTPIKSSSDVDFEDLVPQKVDGPSKVESALRGAAQGLSFGFADEIAAGLESAFTPKTYEQAVIESRNNYAKAEEANPLTYMAGDVAGSVAPVLLSGGLGTAGLAARGVGAAGRLAAAGAIGGGLRGAGDAESMSDIPAEVAKGAVVGGALGAAAPGVGAAGRLLENKVAPMAKQTMEAFGEGIANRNTPFVGPMLNEMVDKVKQNYIQKGYSADVAEQMAYRLAGRLGSTASGVALPGVGNAVAHGALAADLAAAPAGKVLQAVNSKIGPSGIVAATDLATSNVPEGEALVNNIRPSEAFQVAQGTKYQDVLDRARSRGPEALKATIWTLGQDAEFRKLMGK